MSTSVPLGSWLWSAKDSKLDVEIAEQSEFSELAGQWTLDAFAKTLEGLSSGRLRDALSPSASAVRCALNLSNGAVIHFAGAFLSEDEARGIILSDGHVDFTEVNESEDVGPNLKPAFQPIFSLASGQTVGFEALARWENTKGEPLAQRLHEDGLATNMLLQSAETLARMRQIPGAESLFMHVNLTARDIVHPDTPSLIEALINGHMLAPGVLRIELTEQAALRDREQALSAAIALKEAGAGLVLDDFGSGHSSFSWLADLPADSLKIDPELTRRIDDPRTATIIEAIALLARRLDMKTTAEGIEEKEDAATFRALGFDYVQGFAFSRPLSAENAIRFLTED